MIRDPQDPYRMRKEDVIAELRSYGIAVDPYTFANNLSMQLRLARKMTKRNFITVLNYLEIDKDYNEQLRRMEKIAIQQAKFRR